MISFIVLIKRKQGLSKEQFRAYYETHHVALAKEHVAHLFLDYRRNYVNFTAPLGSDEGSAAGSQDGPYDVITTILFESQETFNEFSRIVSRPEIKAAFAEDEAKFMDRAASLVTMCDNVMSATTSDSEH